MKVGRRMAERWELICHHTYQGIPGIVLDRSPTARSPGRAVGLANADFLRDGATPGSGAVSFYKPGARIHVPIGPDNLATWQPLGGVKVDVTFRRDPHPAGVVPIDTLVDAGPFQLYVRINSLVGWVSSYPTQYANISSAFDPVGPQSYQVPTGPWVTVGLLHDGVGTLELHANGQVVARKSGPLAPVNAVGGAGISIGNALNDDWSLHGEIDEVKIWRLNPQRATEEFFSRPMDEQTVDCWRRLLRESRAAFARHPECARELLAGVGHALDRLHRQALATGPETRRRLEQSQRTYRHLWRAGKLDSPEMRKLFADLIAWMSLAGVHPDADPELMALRDSDCLKTILGELSVPDCDPEAIAMLRAIVQGLREASLPRTAGA
jgi:Concanavalin A-like lectin/glucanases superfamily